MGEQIRKGNNGRGTRTMNDENEKLWNRKLNYIYAVLLASTMTDDEFKMYIEECKKENETKSKM